MNVVEVFWVSISLKKKIDQSLERIFFIGFSFIIFYQFRVLLRLKMDILRLLKCLLGVFMWK
jgi:hypothetical protein